MVISIERYVSVYFNPVSIDPDSQDSRGDRYYFNARI